MALLLDTVDNEQALVSGKGTVLPQKRQGNQSVLQCNWCLRLPTKALSGCIVTKASAWKATESS